MLGHFWMHVKPSPSLVEGEVRSMFFYSNFNFKFAIITTPSQKICFRTLPLPTREIFSSYIVFYALMYPKKMKNGNGVAKHWVKSDDPS